MFLFNVPIQGAEDYGASEVGIYCASIVINKQTGPRIQTGMNAEGVNRKGLALLLCGV